MSSSKAMKDVQAERLRQKRDEGYTLESDLANNKPGELALGAAAYAAQVGTTLRSPEDVVPGVQPPTLWPFPASSYKQRDPRQSLVKAAAMLLAEIERYDHDHSPS